MNSLGSGGRICARTSVINFSGFYPGILFLLFVLESLPGYTPTDSPERAGQSQLKNLNMEILIWDPTSKENQGVYLAWIWPYGYSEPKLSWLLLNFLDCFISSNISVFLPLC